MKRTKEINTENKGITLIALVVTIIIILILSAVTITIMRNSGLIGYARKAKGETENKMNTEQQVLEIMVLKDKYLKEIQIGDYVNYPVEYTNVATKCSVAWWDDYSIEEKKNYPSDEFIGWRVLSKETDENGNITHIKLISAGVPINYWTTGSSANIVNKLTTGFLNTSFYESGFTNVTGTTLAGIFANEFTNKVQALTKAELEKAVVDLGGSLTSGNTSVTDSKYKDLFAIPCKENENSEYASTVLATKAPDREYPYDSDIWCVWKNGQVGVSWTSDADPTAVMYLARCAPCSYSKTRGSI